LQAVVVISSLEFGGAQRQVVELVNNIDPAACRLHPVSLSPFMPLTSSLRAGTAPVRCVPRRFRFDFTVVPRLAKVLRETRADVVHGVLFDATIAARLAGRLVRRAAVIDSERNTGYSIKRSEFSALRATQRWNDLTIANSRAGAEFNSGLFGRPMDRYRVVHNGVDVERFQPRASDSIRRELGLGDQLVVGMVASFKPQKNHLVWLRAARQVLARVPNLKLLFIGDELHKGSADSTAFKKTIIGMVAALGLENHCLFLGNKTDVEKYYGACAITVLPSLFEGTPNVALESMACGVPVVASDISDNAYIIRDGQTGYIVPVNDEVALADRVTMLLLNPALREKMALQARNWVTAEFSCQRMAEKMVAVYREAVTLRSGSVLPRPGKQPAAAACHPVNS
jgi:glycosyltransferase involved in cell wall biosynthesis